VSTTTRLQLDGSAHTLTRGPGEGDAVEVEWTAPGVEVAEQQRAEVLETRDGWVRFRMGGRTYRARVVRRGETVWVGIDGETYAFSTASRRRGGGDAAGDGKIEAPMPGALLEVLVREGQEVAEGQDLVVVEAMKMEHRMKAPFAGTVRDLTMAAGDRVEPGNPILVLEPLGEADG